MDTITIIAITFGFSVILALVLGVALGYFREKFKVEKDPKIAEVRAALPSVNCGACGYPGCDAYSEAVVGGSAKLDLCTTGGKACAEALGAIMGVAVKGEDLVVVLACQGTTAGKTVRAVERGEYNGVQTCRAAKLSTGSIKMCVWGCQGLGDCTKKCMFDAIKMEADGLPHVDYSKCTGCGMCAAECPQRILAMVTKDRVGAITLCSNRNPVKPAILKTCSIACIKCELCVKNCPEHCIEMKDGIPMVDAARCTSCNTCVEKCPTKAIVLVEGSVIPFLHRGPPVDAK